MEKHEKTNVIPPAVDNFRGKDQNCPRHIIETSLKGGQSHFYSDIAIKDISEDLLGRVPFANNIANAIYNRQGSECITVGITGSWGSGKTSLLNLVSLRILELSKTEDNKWTTVANFNPWYYSGTCEISKNLFLSISKSIHKNDRKLASLFSSYGNRLYDIWGIVNDGMRIIPSTKAHFLHKVSSFFRRLTSAFREPQTPSIQKIKEQLISTLNEYRGKIIVILDDIDRLHKNELVDILKIIRLHGDLPNIIYILAYQKDVVEQFIKEDFCAGREYLEKIVNVEFAIPQTEQHRINSYILKEIFNIADEMSWQPINFIDTEELKEIIRTYVSKYIVTLRNAKRFLSSIKFLFDHFVAEDVLEVNFTDLLLIELLRMFEHDLYQDLYSHRLQLIGGDPYRETLSSFEDGMPDEDYKELMGKSAKEEYSSEILSYLFPGTLPRPTFMPRQKDEFRSFSEKRISSPLYFDKYFLFQPPHDSPSQSDVDVFEYGTAGEITTAVRNAVVNGRFRILLFHLEMMTDSIAKKNADSTFEAFMNCFEEISGCKEYFELRSKWAIMGNLLLMILAKIKGKSGRSKFLLSQCERHKSVVIQTLILKMIEDHAKDPGMENHFDDDIITSCFEKIKCSLKEDIANDTFNYWEHSKIIAYSILSWLPQDESRVMANDIEKYLLADDDRLFSFLKGIYQFSFIYKNEKIDTIRSNIDISIIYKLFGPEIIGILKQKTTCLESRKVDDENWIICQHIYLRFEKYSESLKPLLNWNLPNPASKP